MAKFTLDNVASGYNRSKINNNFVELQSQLQNNVLYRDNPSGEPNQMENDLDMNGNTVTNLPTPTNNTDAATKKYVDQDFPADIQAQVDLAEDWASKAEDSIVADGKYSSLHYAAKAEDSATAAANSASAASTSESNAAASESAAATSEANAAASFDSFDDRYLGAYATDPTTDNDGNALIDGATYWNTTDRRMRAYDLATTTWYNASEERDFGTTAGTVVEGNDYRIVSNQIESMTDLRAFEGTTDNQQASVLLGDDTYARVYWDAASTATDDGVNVFQVTGVTTGRWIRMDGSMVISTISATGTLPIPPKNGIHYATYDAATGTLTLPTLASTPVGGMIVVQKDNATQGAVDINPDGADAEQWGTAQLRLYADGDKWGIRRGIDRWELVFGYETGSTSDGYYEKRASGKAIAVVSVFLAAANINIASGNIFRSSAAAQTMPMTFANTDYSISYNTSVSFARIVLESESSLGVAFAHPTSITSSTDLNLTVTVIGDWYETT